MGEPISNDELGRMERDARALATAKATLQEAGVRAKTDWDAGAAVLIFPAGTPEQRRSALLEQWVNGATFTLESDVLALVGEVRGLRALVARLLGGCVRRPGDEHEWGLWVDLRREPADSFSLPSQVRTCKECGIWEVRPRPELEPMT